ncbi:MAG: RMD1 family protein, partial [Parabacteroides sp.]|nr:RMD1 family protein [Parabacteroides sp.]
GLMQAAESIKKNGFVYLVWSTKDLVTMFAAGFTNTVACCCKELTFNHIEQLSKYTNRVVFIYRDSVFNETLMTKSIMRLNRYSIDGLRFSVYGKLPIMFNYMGKYQFESFISQSTHMIFMSRKRDELIEKLEQIEKSLEKENDLTEKIKQRSEMIQIRKEIDKLSEMLSE